MSFSDDIRKFKEKSIKAAADVVRKSAHEVFARVVKRSPVGDPDKWQSKPPPGYKGGTTFRGAWQFQQVGPEFHIFNNLPYALPLEHGWSQQAPHGMVKVTVTEWNDIVNRNI